MNPARRRHLAEVDRALAPVKDLLDKTRMNVTVQFNPLVMQLCIDYARVHAIAAIAARASGTDEDDTAAVAADNGGLSVRATPEPPQPPNGLIVPG